MQRPAFLCRISVIDDPRAIGQGLAFLNRYLCDKLLTEFHHWLEALFNALHVLEQDGMQILINDRIQSGIELSEQVKQALKFLGESAVDHPKPAPDLFLYTATQLGLDPVHCVVVEDAPAGIAAAIAAGMWAIGLDSAVGVASSIENQPGAAHIVLPNLMDTHLSELQAKLAKAHLQVVCQPQK